MEDFRNLLPFIQAAQSGSFSAAAGKLGVTPAAVSKSIARLEQALGARLFNRTTRQLHLTSDGRLFFDKVSASMAGLDEAFDVLNQARGEPAGLVRLTTLKTFGRQFLLPMIPDFLARYPKVDVEVKFDDGITDLVMEGYDIGIRRRSQRESSYVSRSLYWNPLILVASPAYLARRGIPQRPEDLATHECIVVRFPGGRTARWEFVTPGPAHARRSRNATPGERTPDSSLPRYVHHPKGHVILSEQVDALIDIARLGQGIILVGANFALPGLRDGSLKVLLPEHPVKADTGVTIQYPHREYLALKVRVLVEYLVERCAAHPDFHCDIASLAPYRAPS